MTTTKNPTRTKKFRALLALLDNDEAAAIRSWNGAHPDNPIPVEVPEVNAEVAKLMDAGFTLEEAEAALAAAAKKADQPKAEAAPLTSQEQAEALVAKAGLIHVRGRVYVTGPLLEAQARVLKTGRPEVVRNDGSHRTKGVVIYRLDDGKTVAVQNVGEQN